MTAAAARNFGVRIGLVLPVVLEKSHSVFPQARIVPKNVYRINTNASVFGIILGQWR
jgi:hypothetical protein